MLIFEQLAVAQSVSLGILGGVQATRELSPRSGDPTDESKRYVVGPLLDVGLARHWSIELDALYRRTGYTDPVYGCCGDYGITRERANSWEFPILAKYNFHRAFVGGGLSFRTIHGADIASGYNVTGLSATPPYYTYTYFFNKSATDYSALVGVVISGGFSVNAGRVRLTPQLRYTRWDQTYVTSYVASQPWSSNENEVSIDLGLTWHLGRK